jgi:hypothetical protein
MSVRPPAVEPIEPGEPSNRWPWVALALGVLIVVLAAAFFFFNRSRTVNVTVEGTPTVNAIAKVVSPVPPTLVPPTLPASATLAPTATALPSATPPPPTPTAVPAPTQPPAPTQAQSPTQAPAPAADATQPPAVAAPPAAPTQPPSGQPTPPATSAPTAAPAAPSPTAFAGQVANSGGIGNTRTDLDAAYGAAAGETPEHLVVYRKNNLEYHVGFVPDPNGRAALIVELPQANAQPWTLQQAQAEGHKLLPKDAQPPNPPAEGNDQFVVERYTSQSLAQALPAQVFTANNGQPGQFLAVYVKDSPQGTHITRIVVGPGNDPQALINQGR